MEVSDKVTQIFSLYETGEGEMPEDWRHCWKCRIVVEGINLRNPFFLSNLEYDDLFKKHDKEIIIKNTRFEIARVDIREIRLQMQLDLLFNLLDEHEYRMSRTKFIKILREFDELGKHVFDDELDNLVVLLSDDAFHLLFKNVFWLDEDLDLIEDDEQFWKSLVEHLAIAGDVFDQESYLLEDINNKWTKFFFSTFIHGKPYRIFPPSK